MFGKRRSGSNYEEKTPYNNSFGKLRRLSSWFEVAGQAKVENLLEEYFNALENVYSELYPHLLPAEQKEIDVKILEIERFLDNSALGNNYDQLVRLNRRKASNLCDKLRLRLATFSFKYNLEWFDVAAWSKEQREIEPVVRG